MRNIACGGTTTLKFEETPTTGHQRIVESAGAILEVYRLDKSGHYTRIGAYGAGETVSPVALPELAVDLSLVFRDYSAQERGATR